MEWLVGVAGYAFAVWLFLRFFHFVSEVDRDIETMQNNIPKSGDSNAERT